MPTEDNSASKTTTPGRSTTPLRSLAHLFRTPSTVSRRNKRTRAHASSVSSTATPLPSSTPESSLPPVILQTYSVSTDSIVLTALPAVPFCCHEDLLTMSRIQLEGVVHTLNARLPYRLRIGPDAEVNFWNNDDDQEGEAESEADVDGLSRMSEAEMRKRIEELVGIRAVVGKNRVPRSGLGLGTRAGVPPAPKAVRTRDATWRPDDANPWEMEVDGVSERTDDLGVMIEDALVGSSPLAARTKLVPHTRIRNGALSRLAILQEENEWSESQGDEDADDETRPWKRQRTGLKSGASHSKERPGTIQEDKESRLIENMDHSGSPLLEGEADKMSDASKDGVIATTMGQEGDTVTSGEPPQRRRSARIREIALRRSSSADTGKYATLAALHMKAPFLRSRTFCSRRSSPTMKDEAAESHATPREFTIRLPFTSTPPTKAESSAWSAPRILRSHSQRVLKSGQGTKTEVSLGRSHSERYPRAIDMTFVTTDRPRYRFTRRKSKTTKLVLPADLYIENREDQKGNDPRLGQLGTLPSAIADVVTHSRVPSASTVASNHGGDGDSLRASVKENTAPPAVAETPASDGVTAHVWKALERMVVDVLE